MKKEDTDDKKKALFSCKDGIAGAGIAAACFRDRQKQLIRRRFITALTYRSAQTERHLQPVPGTRIIHGMRRMTVPLYIPA